MKENILEKLKELCKREKKRRDQAVRYLEKITEEMAEPLEQLLGNDLYDDVPKGYIWVDRGLYFRYKEHYEKEEVERVGFYISSNELPIWGSPLEEVKGKMFWEYIIEICEWLEKLPAFIEQSNKGRETNLRYLKTIVETIEREKKKNRSE